MENWMKYVGVLLVVFLLFGCASNNQRLGADQETMAVQNQPQQSMPTPSGYMGATEVAQHNGASSCWIIYNGAVYDITNLLSTHTNSSIMILPFCGKIDDSFDRAFTEKHGIEKVGQLINESRKMGEYAQ